MGRVQSTRVYFISVYRLPPNVARVVLFAMGQILMNQRALASGLS